jgi:hypothetical protein
MWRHAVGGVDLFVTADVRQFSSRRARPEYHFIEGA